MGYIPASVGACILHLSARWLLGWASYDTLVPPAAPKWDSRGHLVEPTLEMDLPEPWAGHKDPDTGRTFYYNKVTKDATWRRPSEPQRLPRTMGGAQSSGD